MSRPPLYDIFDNPKMMGYVFLLIFVIIVIVGVIDETVRATTLFLEKVGKPYEITDIVDFYEVYLIF